MLGRRTCEAARPGLDSTALVWPGPSVPSCMMKNLQFEAYYKSCERTRADATSYEVLFQRPLCSVSGLINGH